MSERKTLCFVRHGKSTWGYENVYDLDRPLKNRGIQNAYEMSSRLLEKGVKPDLIVSSPAVRALHTAVIFAGELKCPFENLKINEIIYYADENQIIEFIKKTSDAVSELMIFGHNPVISNLANMFQKKQVEYMPTTAIVQLIFETNSWMKISRENLVEEWYRAPKKS